MIPTSDRRLVRGTVFIIALLAVFPASARLINIPRPDELTAKAPIICNGTVVALENTLKKEQAVLPNYPQMTVATEIWKAKIKVLSSFKGKVPDEIEMRFTQYDEHTEKTTVICDGPLQITLQLNKRYRFYLKPGPDPQGYVGVLDGDYDDAYAVQSLADIEPDDSPPPVSREEAIKCATEYVTKFQPEVKVSDSLSEATDWEGKWTVKFWRSPENRRDSEPDAVIHVVGNGQIDDQSWVSDGSRSAVSDLTPADLGHEFWIHLTDYFKDKPYIKNPSDPIILRGHLKSFTNQNVEWVDVSYPTQTWPTLTIPASHIVKLQRLISEATPSAAPKR